ncbi:MAG: adenylate/guanylate cyclase domain-containing protein, partial [Planctomycetota bacterium]
MQQKLRDWSTRSLLGVIFAPLGGVVFASIFNIWYNLQQIRPLLSGGQLERFVQATTFYNVLAYPVGVGLWFWIVFSLRRPFRSLVEGAEISERDLGCSRARAINLPWHFSLLCLLGWLGCIPVFWLALEATPDALHPAVVVHLTISFVIGGLINVTHGFFAVEIASHRLIFPVLFEDCRPAETSGAITLTIRRRGLLWAISAGACPIASVILLGWAAQDFHLGNIWFEIMVGSLGILFGLFSAWLLGQLVARPVDQLRLAARDVAAGKLDTRIDLLRADEFGPLIDEFNRMVREMKAKEELRETFGVHVGKQAASQILKRDPGLGGSLETVTVMFCDIRNFTTRGAKSSAQEVVALLNLFFETMVDVVETRHGGMVNKFLGDGFMAIFSETVSDDHATDGVQAAEEMLVELERINRLVRDQGQEVVRIGIGIHTGSAIVGSVGSPRRMEYTVMGDSVNLAARLMAACGKSATTDANAVIVDKGTSVATG